MRPETLKGHLDGMLLATLEPGPRHGYAIMAALRVDSGGQLLDGQLGEVAARLPGPARARAGIIVELHAGRGARRCLTARTALA